jgi:hypothetical protein
MGLEMRGIDHHSLGRTCLACQGRKDAFEHTASAPADKAVIHRLVRAKATRRVLPLQPIADDIDNPANYATIVDTR